MNKPAAKEKGTNSVVVKKQHSQPLTNERSDVHPAVLLRVMLCQSGKEIAALLGVGDGEFRQMQLSSGASRSPRKVEPMVSRKLVEEWGIRPWEFWRERRLENLLHHGVTRTWIAIWRSTAGEFAELEKLCLKWQRSYIWEALIAARCELARKRSAWTHNQTVEICGEAAGGDEGEEERDLFLAEVVPNRPLENQQVFKTFLSMLRENCPAIPYSGSRVACATAQLQLRQVRCWCWEMTIPYVTREKGIPQDVCIKLSGYTSM